MAWRSRQLLSVIAPAASRLLCGNQRVRRGGRKNPSILLMALARNIADLRCPLGHYRFSLPQPRSCRTGLALTCRPSIVTVKVPPRAGSSHFVHRWFGFFLFVTSQKHPVGCGPDASAFQRPPEPLRPEYFGHEFCCTFAAITINHGQRNGQNPFPGFDRVILTLAKLSVMGVRAGLNITILFGLFPPPSD